MSKYFSNINLNKNELQNAVIHLVASSSSITSPVQGQIIYDQSDDLIKYYDGSIWVAANDLEIIIHGDSGTATLVRNEPLTFVGGSNLTSLVTSSDDVEFSLDPVITLTEVNADATHSSTVVSTDISVVDLSAENIDSDTLSAHDVFATDANFVNVETESVSTNTFFATDGEINSVSGSYADFSVVDSHAIRATDVSSRTGSFVNVNALNGFISGVVASDVETETIFADSGSIGTVVFNTNDTTITSGLVVASDLVVNGAITGDISASDVSGVLYEVTTESGDFSVSRGDVVTYEGTTNEIEVTSPSQDTVKIGIVDDPTLTGNVTVTGDLTVQGETTTVNSQTLLVNDPILSLNNGVGDNNPNDLGFILERGSLDTDYNNIAIVWDEDGNRLHFQTTLETASDTEIDFIDYYHVEMGELTVASDITISGRIDSYDGSVPNQGSILVGGSSGYQNGTFTVSTDSGLSITRTDTNINVAVDVDSATDGSGITIDAADQFLISDGGVEKRVRADQLGDLYVSHNESQSLSSSDQQQARENISSVEVITSTFSGTGASSQTYYIPHGLNQSDVLVQVFDNLGEQVYADVDTNVPNGSGNYVSVSGNFASGIDYTVRVLGTRGTPITVASTTTAP